MSTDVLHCLNCAKTDVRTALQKTCPICSNLFQAESEVPDRRPMIACVSGDTICADCCNECRKRPDVKCPTCGQDLLLTPIVNKMHMELIKICTSVLEISVKEIDMEKDAFARGGFGQVHKAKWQKKEVVVKVVITEHEDALREASLTVRLKHQNVVQLFGITGVMSNKLGIVMELAEHGSLDKWIGKIDHEKLTLIALGIVNGLEYVHSQKVIHRDIKPRNILMFGPQDDMVPKIADFGVSKVIESVMIMTKHMVGQELYMAPEVRFNMKYGFPADIFSLAMTLFEMFNEQLITEGSEELQQFRLKLHGGIVDDIPRSCKVPEYLRDVIKRGWSSVPTGRPTLSEYRSTLWGEKVSQGDSPPNEPPAQGDTVEDFRQSFLSSAARVIKKISTNRRVAGVTSVDDELFALLWRVNNQVAVYSINDYRLLRRLNVPWYKPDDNSDITSCIVRKLLYMSDWGNRCVHRYDLTSSASSKWSVPGKPTCLSVTTPSGELLVTCWDTTKLVQMSTSGLCVREIALQWDIREPRHGVQLTNGQYVVCRGGFNTLPRVCAIGDDGKVTHSYGGQRGSDVGQLNYPCHLAVDKDSQFIIVADCYNDRVVLLSPTLEFVRYVIESLSHPNRLYFHQSTRRLFVGQLYGDVTVIQL